MPVPETVPTLLNGKYRSSQGTTLGTSETPAVAVDQPDFLPVSGELLPLEDEEVKKLALLVLIVDRYKRQVKTIL